ncbi:MAG: hypothetical protein ACSHX3_08585 [Litorimonas sp.]
MKQILTAVFASLIALPLLSFAGQAQAADPFTVAKVSVDARAESAIQAQSQAVQTGYIIAARELLNRLTLESERSARGLPPLTVSVVGPLIRGQTIDNERRSNTRYIGDLSISFNPAAVQRLLRDANLTMVTSQARERLAIPVGVTTTSPLATDLLSGRFEHALTPIKSISADDMANLYGEAPTSAQIQRLASRYGVDQVLIIREGEGGRVTATDLSLDTGASARVSSSRGMVGLVARMESAWKEASAVTSENAQSSTVSVLFGSMAEWQRLQGAINNSAQLRDARLDALSKDGALMTISYGSLDRLAAEMAQKGVRVFNDPNLGLVIRR